MIYNSAIKAFLQPSGGFFDLDNLHNVLSFPVGEIYKIIRETD